HLFSDSLKLPPYLQKQRSHDLSREFPRAFLQEEDILFRAYEEVETQKHIFHLAHARKWNQRKSYRKQKLFSRLIRLNLRPGKSGAPLPGRLRFLRVVRRAVLID